MIRQLLLTVLFAGFGQVAMAQRIPLETGVLPDGVPIYYQIHGSRDGAPVILIHGFGGHFDEARYEWLIDLFSEYRLIAIDARGHGRSGKPSDPSDYGLAVVEDLDRLLHHLKLTDAHIVGISMGGLVGLKYASLHPDKVRSLTMVGQGLAPRESFQQWIEMGRAVVESNERTVEQEVNFHMYSGFLRGYLPILVTEEEAKALDIPLLVAIGEDDERLEIARNLKGLYPATKLIVAPGFDHARIMTRDSPATFSITGFIRNIEK